MHTLEYHSKSYVTSLALLTFVILGCIAQNIMPKTIIFHSVTFSEEKFYSAKVIIQQCMGTHTHNMLLTLTAIQCSYKWGNFQIYEDLKRREKVKMEGGY